MTLRNIDALFHGRDVAVLGTPEDDAIIGLRRTKDHVDRRTAVEPHAIDHDRPDDRQLREGDRTDTPIAPDVFQHDRFELGFRHLKHFPYLAAVLPPLVC